MRDISGTATPAPRLPTPTTGVSLTLAVSLQHFAQAPWGHLSPLPSVLRRSASAESSSEGGVLSGPLESCGVSCWDKTTPLCLPHLHLQDATWLRALSSLSTDARVTW